jgi:putative exporter of polyketide antibiotics
MDVFTHALAPVIVTRMVAGHAPWLRKYGFIAIGLFGALPDMLNPHLSLAARLSSWSHGLPFWGGLTVSLLLVSIFKRAWIDPRLAAVLSLAYLFHMICDAISGSIDWLYPFGKFIWGDYYVDPLYWIPLDVVCFLITYYLFRIAPVRSRLKEKVRKPS